MTKGDIAEKNFLEGYNCAQAVTLAFANEMGVDTKTALMLSSSFGGGLGRLRETCGAVSGMCVALGAIEGYDDPKDLEGKKSLYATVQQLVGRFKEINGSYVCRDLLKELAGEKSAVPELRTEEYYKKRPCAKHCRQAAEILEEYLKDRGIIK